MAKKLFEAATIKARAQAAARALKVLLADKTLPADLRTAAESLHGALKKKWADLEAAASAESGPSASAPGAGASAQGATLEEGRNMGDVMFARMHSSMIMQLDDQLGWDQLTYDEYGAALKAAELALATFRAILSQDAPQVFTREPWRSASDSQTIMPSESSPSTSLRSAQGDEIVGDTLELVEKVVRRDGTIPIKIIQPGWGSTGYYPADVLERDGPRIFQKGLHMYWNHPTQREEAERPERDLDDLAAVLMSDARWDANGLRGPGLYADALVMEHYRSKVDEMAPHIGTSIRAFGTAQYGEAEGKQGPIITAMTAGRSVDFVTAAGAGGEIITMFESARKRAVLATPTNGDVSIQSPTEETSMDEKELKEANAALQRQLDEAKARADRADEALILREAKDVVTLALGKHDLPAVTKTRLVESLAKNAPVKDGALDKAAFEAQITEAVKAEVKYLSEAAGLGSIRGMGSAPASENDDDTDAPDSSLEESFLALGLSESAAKMAAKGRK